MSVAILFNGFGANGIVTDVAGTALEYPAVLESTATSWTAELELSVYSYVGPTVTQNTRTFNGELTGPTIKVKPGDTLQVALTNSLAEEAHDTSSLHNEYRDLDTTNLHTHGLHIDGEPPGDSIFTEVKPGETYTYTYEIPDDHLGGTFWYHPHHHGSTAIHAGGGAAGLIIVEDSAGTIPDELANMEEVLLFMAHINMPEITTISQQWETNCQGLGGSVADCTDTVWAPGATSGAQADVVLVNGQTTPSLAITANKWYRFRMVFAAVDAILTPTLTGCTVMLIAKDGVYLSDAPRAFTAGGYMGPGNRADWAVSCPAGTHTLASGAARRRKLEEQAEEGAQEGRRLGGPAPGAEMAGGGAGNAETVADLVTITATDDGTAATTLSAFDIQKPCYLVDLFDQTASSTTLFDLGPAPRINGNSYDTSTTYEASFAVGQVHELTLSGINAHPFHLHVNSFQIAADPDDTNGDYFKQGDWHDVMITPGDAVTARFQTDRYVGKQVIHCHILEHEDEGMMLVTTITGTDGTLWTGAETVDANCYRGVAPTSYSSPPNPPSIPPLPPGTAQSPSPSPPPPVPSPPPTPPSSPPPPEEEEEEEESNKGCDGGCIGGIIGGMSGCIFGVIGGGMWYMNKKKAAAKGAGGGFSGMSMTSATSAA